MPSYHCSGGMIPPPSLLAVIVGDASKNANNNGQRRNLNVEWVFSLGTAWCRQLRPNKWIAIRVVLRATAFFFTFIYHFFLVTCFFFSHLFLTCSEKASSSCLFSGLVPVGFLLQAVFQDLPWNTYSEKNPLNSESKTMVYDAVAILVFLHKNKISSTRKIRPKKTAHI